MNPTEQRNHRTSIAEIRSEMKVLESSVTRIMEDSLKEIHRLIDGSEDSNNELAERVVKGFTDTCDSFVKEIGDKYESTLNKYVLLEERFRTQTEVLRRDRFLGRMKWLFLGR